VWYARAVIRRKRSEQREQQRALRKLVRDREKLAALSVGGSEDRPIQVTSAAVVEVRVRHLACPQCEGEYKVQEHRSPASGIRSVDVTCQRCGVPRTLWFRIVSLDAN
jgi:predicted Zn finger-like uncharacterized protein